jgi:hypothetical protein
MKPDLLLAWMTIGESGREQTLNDRSGRKTPHHIHQAIRKGQGRITGDFGDALQDSLQFRDNWVRQ